MQAALGAMRLRVLGAELNGVPIDGDHINEFCSAGAAQVAPHFVDAPEPLTWSVSRFENVFARVVLTASRTW